MVFLKNTFFRSAMLLRTVAAIIHLALFDTITFPMLYVMGEWGIIQGQQEDSRRIIRKYKALLTYMFTADVIDKQEIAAIQKRYKPEYYDDE